MLSTPGLVLVFGGLHEATLSPKASPRALHGDGPWDVHTKPPTLRQERKGSQCHPTLPAAWTTRPNVVVILELLGLAVSGSEVKISKSATKQCETDTARTVTWRRKNSLKALKVHYNFPMTIFALWLQTLRSFPCPERGGQGELFIHPSLP